MQSVNHKKREEGLLSTNTRQYRSIIFTVYVYEFLPKRTVLMLVAELVTNALRYSRKSPFVYWY